MQLFQKPIPVFLLAIALAGSVLPAESQTRWPLQYETDSLPSFRLPAVNGKKLRFETGTSLSCFFFLSPECPLCKNYAALIKTLQQTYSKTIAFYLVVPGTSFSKKEIKGFSNEYLNGAVLYKDADLRLTQYLHATTTPEVVLLETQSGRTVYSGALDNWAVSLGKQRSKATENYLLDAVEQYLHQQPVAVAHKEPVGCLINDF